MTVSFCIITGGKRAETIGLGIKSIQAQRMPTYEIIVAGRHHDEPGITYLPAAHAADRGMLGLMRNLAVSRAQYENIVLLDDDIILAPQWYESLEAYDRPFDILTSQIRVPDGSRYLDHATVGGPRGQIILDEGEDDEYVYMTGGGGWLMKDYVARQNRWDDTLAFYENEDVDFSRRCQAAGFKISHNHKMLVFHADATYTAVGRTIFRRSGGRSQEWIISAIDRLTPIAIIKQAIFARLNSRMAEAADYLRMGMEKYPSSIMLKMIFSYFIMRTGGALSGSRWFPKGDPVYLDAVSRYRSLL
jgi:glycosyltransferase involved in cell wall biosynthesis